MNEAPPKRRVLLAEMERRSVFRASAVYGAASFVMLEALRIWAPALGVVPVVVKVATVIVLLGYPVALWLAWHYELYGAGALVRLDHFNQVTPNVPVARKYMEDLGFRVTEDIQDEAGVTYAAWMRRKPTVHDTAMTGGDGPRMHHIAFATHEKHNILYICDKLGALRKSDLIERGPGRHGVSNAFYLYLRDPDGHRVEIYTQDYYTGDPDNPVVTWDVHDNQRRDWWGNPVVPSWYTDASLVLDLDGNPQQVVKREETSELEATIGADGFSYTRKGDTDHGFKLGHQL